MKRSAPHASTLARRAELETRYDGPIPTRALDALRHGSPLAADIAETRAEIAFFRDMAARARRSGKTWRARGEFALAARAATDCRIYLAGWRLRRRRLQVLERARRVEAAGLRTMSAIVSLLAPLTRPTTGPIGDPS
jgi:hypothetical protein